jgi:hypothetical protein
MRRRWPLFEPTRDKGLILAWALAAVVVWLAVDAAATRRWGHDAHAYWLVQLGPDAYDRIPGQPDAFLYSPAFAQVAQLLTWIPWPAFVTLWTAAAIGTYLWLVRPLRWVFAVPLLALAIEDVALGNITWLLALLAVGGLRVSSVWVPAAYVKVVSGLGVLWYAGRREWRALVVAAGVGLAVLAVSYAISPDMWRAYVELLTTVDGDGTLPRAAVAAVLIWWAGRTNRPWLVLCSLVLCSPLMLAYALGYLVALPRVLRPETLARLNAPFGGPRAVVRRVLDLPAAPGADPVVRPGR